MNAVFRSGSDLEKCLEVLRRTDSLGTLRDHKEASRY